MEINTVKMEVQVWRKLTILCCGEEWRVEARQDEARCGEPK
jgi:hypothetical protein